MGTGTGKFDPQPMRYCLGLCHHRAFASLVRTTGIYFVAKERCRVEYLRDPLAEWYFLGVGFFTGSLKSISWMSASVVGVGRTRIVIKRCINSEAVIPKTLFNMLGYPHALLGRELINENQQA
jgi:hypothetical protein